MKFGIRTPSLKKSISARTTGKAKRKLKRITNPFYGKAGTGWISNPKKAAYNKIYSKSTVSFKGVSGCLAACVFYPLYWAFLLYWYAFKFLFLGLYWLVIALINGVIALVEWIINLIREKQADKDALSSGYVTDSENTPPE